LFEIETQIIEFGLLHWYKCTVKPMLTTTSEQRPLVNNAGPESLALIYLQWI
jgi:hypothetical protein